MDGVDGARKADPMAAVEVHDEMLTRPVYHAVKVVVVAERADATEHADVHVVGANVSANANASERKRRVGVWAASSENVQTPRSTSSWGCGWWMSSAERRC